MANESGGWGTAGIRALLAETATRCGACRFDCETQSAGHLARLKRLLTVAAACIVASCAGCSGGGGPISGSPHVPSGSPTPVFPSGPTPVPTDRAPSPTPAPSQTPLLLIKGLHGIEHIVIVVQENRSFDNLFHGYPGADS